MKKGKTGLLVATMLVVAVLGGCGSKQEADVSIADSQNQEAESFTVTFYDSDSC